MRMLSLVALISLVAACRTPSGTTKVKAEGPEPMGGEFNEDNCLGNQDMNAEDVDISNCPALPSYTSSAPLGNTGRTVSLGSWELGTTKSGKTYKYGSLSEPGTNPRVLSYGGGSEPVQDDNVICWAKGYYRLRKMLQNPPEEYLKLHAKGFQTSFFQFQTDLRNGATGFKRITSYMDHLVKWVTVIKQDGTCVQPTLGRFKAYATQELVNRGISN